MALVALLAVAGLMAGQFARADEARPPTPGSAPEVAPPAPATEASADAAPTAALVRVSSSFELKHAGSVLKQVAKLFSAGFVRKDAERVAAEIDAQPAEQSRSWEFTAVRKGKSYLLRVRARPDEFGDLDLDFFSPPEIAAAVRSAVDRYLNGRGL
ncbi:MAG TPA: hypothetical protein VKT74_07010 [Gammaproteobacteria bacterium]|nr:hypothetical protein [Gammaproteobacteria bacterium]